MQVSQVLDVMEALLRASEHPDITGVSRYGADTEPGGQFPPGVKVTHQTGSAAMLWAAAAPKPAPAPAPLPEEMPSPVHRSARLLVLAVQLLDAAQPAEFAKWEPVAFAGVHVAPAGIKVTCRDGSVSYLRTTAVSGPGGSGGEPEIDPYSDYRIPEGVHEWPRKASAASVEPALA